MAATGDQFDGVPGVHKMAQVVDSKCKSQLRYHSIRPEVSCCKLDRQLVVIRAEINIGEIGKLDDGCTVDGAIKQSFWKVKKGEP